MLDLGTIRNTVTADVTDTAASYTGTAPFSYVLVRADRNVCLAVDRVATTADFKLAADELVRLRLEPTHTLSYVLAEGETDGAILITESAP